MGHLRFRRRLESRIGCEAASAEWPSDVAGYAGSCMLLAGPCNSANDKTFPPFRTPHLLHRPDNVRPKIMPPFFYTHSTLHLAHLAPCTRCTPCTSMSEVGQHVKSCTVRTANQVGSPECRITRLHFVWSLPPAFITCALVRFCCHLTGSAPLDV